MNFIQALMAAIAAAVSPQPLNEVPPAIRMPTPPALSQTVIMPKTAEEFFIRGLERKHAGDYYAAIADFSKAIERSPQAKYYFMRGLAYRKVVEEYKALKDIDQVLIIQPKNHTAMVVRGFIFMALGRFIEARLNFNQAILLNPNPDYFFSRALLNKHEGKKSEAIADLNNAAQGYKIRGDNRKYKEAMDMISSL